jgi:KipI family sensor histidine kinase inhibitor
MMATVNLLPVGRDAVLVEVGSTADALSLASWCREHAVADDVVPGAHTVLLDGLGDRAHLERLLSAWRPAAVEEGPQVEVPVSFDGPDLDAVADRWGCASAEVGERLAAVELVSAFCGFAPGFAYLSGLEVEVSRLPTPRTRVPAGSVAVAGTWCGVYPTASPGGWRIIGRTDVVLWDPERPQPALLAPGTRVRFVPA